MIESGHWEYLNILEAGGGAQNDTPGRLTDLSWLFQSLSAPTSSLRLSASGHNGNDPCESSDIEISRNRSIGVEIPCRLQQHCVLSHGHLGSESFKSCVLNEPVSFSSDSISIYSSSEARREWQMFSGVSNFPSVMCHP